MKYFICLPPASVSDLNSVDDVYLGKTVISAHYSAIIVHYSAIIAHYSPLQCHYSAIIAHYSAIIAHYSPLQCHYSPLQCHYTTNEISVIRRITSKMAHYNNAITAPCYYSRVITDLCFFGHLAGIAVITL